MANAILIPGKEKRVYGGHPWVFRSDIARVEGDFTPRRHRIGIFQQGQILGEGVLQSAEPDFPAHHEPARRTD